MSQLRSNLRATVAMALLLGAGGALAEPPERSASEAPPPAPAHVEPPRPGSRPPSVPRRGGEERPAPAGVIQYQTQGTPPQNGAQYGNWSTAPGGARPGTGNSAPPPAMMGYPYGFGGAPQPWQGRPGTQGGSQPAPPGGRPGRPGQSYRPGQPGPMTQPGQSGQFRGAPGQGGAPPVNVPGQYRGHHGSWHGPPPGAARGRPEWDGGSWNGRWWPRVYYNWNYPLYISVLPSEYATYWWGNVPYYYVNNVYYTWSPQDAGYVVTDPPPALPEQELSAAEVAGGPAEGADGDEQPAPAPEEEIYAYPRHGQSADRQARDKYECHQWARDQSRYDPTNPEAYAPADGPENYRRAMIACLDARGYSAR